MVIREISHERERIRFHNEPYDTNTLWRLGESILLFCCCFFFTTSFSYDTLWYLTHVNRFGTDLKQITDFVTTYDTLWYLGESIHYFCPSSFLSLFFLMIPYGTWAKVSPMFVPSSFVPLFFLMIPYCTLLNVTEAKSVQIASSCWWAADKLLINCR